MLIVWLYFTKPRTEDYTHEQHEQLYSVLECRAMPTQLLHTYGNIGQRMATALHYNTWHVG